MRISVIFFGFSGILISGPVYAQDEADPIEITQAFALRSDGLARQNLDYRLKPFDFGLMGDSIDPYSGTLVFNATDVALPGNSGLEVAFRRKAKAPDTGIGGSSWPRGIDDRKKSALANWSVDVPYISSRYVPEGFYDPWWKSDRCSQLGAEREGAAVLAFNGVELNIPGRGAEKVLAGGGDALPWVAAGEQWFDIAGVTPSHAKIKCIADIGVANGGGEGFLVSTPDGTRYRMDRRIEADAGTFLVPCGGGAGLRRRLDSRLVATEVTDVHGNWVKYDYSVDGNLIKIHGNDGRQIDISYISGTKNIASVTANGRTWTYQYAEYNAGTQAQPQYIRILSHVVQPDGAYWQFDTAEGADIPATIKHPYGTVANYSMSSVTHYTKKDFGAFYCTTNYAYNYRDERNRAVITKTLSGPNIPTSTWNFSYANLGTVEFSETDELTKKNTVTAPDGSVSENEYYISGNKAGRPVSSKLFSYLNGPIIEEVSYTYNVGSELAQVAGMETFLYLLSLKQPVLESKKVIRRGSDVFTTDTIYNSNTSQVGYSYGRPVLTSSYSNLSSEVRTEAISYEHNKAKWILGRPDQVTRNGKLFDDLGYDSFGNVLTHDQFGVRRGTYTYHTTGTAAGLMASSKDGLNRTTLFNNWKRGAAQQVTRPDGVNLLATVDDNGWVTNQTDANGNQTGFQYTSVGWMAKIDRPSPWQDTDITYTDIGGANFHQTAVRGTEESVIWYDTLHRPWSERVRPLSGGGATTHTRIAYDTSNREAFRSFPSASANPTDGVTFTYDSLGRALTSAENVAPFATTSHAYLAGNKKQTTDPEGSVTTTTLRAYGRPERGEVVQIAESLGRFTDITYDNYGNMLTATQYGSQNGFNVTNTQKYVYDGRLRLCRHSVPETGDTLYEYDDANQAIGVAEGQAAGTACAALPAAEKIASTHDNLGRVTLIDFPGATPDASRTYDNNGNVTRNLRGITDWRYVYDNADQLTEEKLLIDGRTYTTSYEYGALGDLAYQTFPTGRRVDFAPNGLGQATKAQHVGGTAYASGMTYHTNGAVDAINYGNGFVHNTTFDSRQLLSSIYVRSGATKAVDLTYGYDKNSRVTSVVDGAVAGQNKTFTYDGLGRLKAASGPWGGGAYIYDALGNLRQKALGARVVNIEYDGLNRLQRVQDTANGNVWQNYAYDVRGNVTNNGVIAFTYDFSNQPNAVTSPVSTGEFVYDGALKRAKQVLGGKAVYSVYGLSGALLHRDDATTGTATDYIRAAGKTVARVRGTEVTYPHQDRLGSPVASTNAAGAVAWHEDFTPYGEKRLDPFGNKDDESFTGHISDSATGLTYMQARYYDPVIGRFLSKDPVGFAKGGVNYFNRYAYSANDPVNLIDPTGRQSERAMDLKLGNYRGAEALRYECTGGCAVVARKIAEAAPIIADFIPVFGDVKAGAEFVQNPSLVGGLAAVVGLVPGLGDAAGKALKGFDSPAVQKAAESVTKFLGEGDPRVITREGGNLSVVSADGQRQVRLEFTEKGKEIRPHAHVEQRDARGNWEAVEDEHIFFREPG